ncbi:MAG TPA: hypothetical protein VGH87_29900 [Polyangiaceae bacterium]|jgi:hypothetical protein|nr:hypothetical protein [Polyangiaceae bacterium]
MTTPQNPARRHKQKIRRSKQLAEWRARHPKAQPSAATSPKKPAAKPAK